MFTIVDRIQTNIQVKPIKDVKRRLFTRAKLATPKIKLTVQTPHLLVNCQFRQLCTMVLLINTYIYFQIHIIEKLYSDTEQIFALIRYIF